MTINTLKIELTCNGRTLVMGPNEDIDITKVTGLESSELEISTSDNALVVTPLLERGEDRPLSTSSTCLLSLGSSVAFPSLPLLLLFQP